MRGPVHTVQHVDFANHAELGWTPEVVERGLTCVVFDGWLLPDKALSFEDLPHDFKVLREVVGNGIDSVLAEVGVCLIYLTLNDGDLSVRVAGPTRAAAEDAILVLRAPVTASRRPRASCASIHVTGDR